MPRTITIALINLLLMAIASGQSGRYPANFIYLSEGCHVSSEHIGLAELTIDGAESYDDFLGQRVYLHQEIIRQCYCECGNCKMCRKEGGARKWDRYGELDKIHAEGSDKGLQIISVFQGDAKDIQKITKALGISYIGCRLVATKKIGIEEQKYSSVAVLFRWLPHTHGIYIDEYGVIQRHLMFEDFKTFAPSIPNEQLMRPMWTWPAEAKKVTDYARKRQLQKALDEAEALGEETSWLAQDLIRYRDGEVAQLESKLQSGDYHAAKIWAERIAKEWHGSETAGTAKKTLSDLRNDPLKARALKAEGVLRDCEMDIELRKITTEGLLGKWEKQVTKIKKSYSGKFLEGRCDGVLAWLKKNHICGSCGKFKHVECPQCRK